MNVLSSMRPSLIVHVVGSTLEVVLQREGGRRETHSSSTKNYTFKARPAMRCDGFDAS